MSKKKKQSKETEIKVWMTDKARAYIERVQSHRRDAGLSYIAYPKFYELLAERFLPQLVEEMVEHVKAVDSIK